MSVPGLSLVVLLLSVMLFGASGISALSPVISALSVSPVSPLSLPVLALSSFLVPSSASPMTDPDLALEERGIHSLCRKYRQYYNVSSIEIVLDIPHLVSAQEVVGCKGGCSLSYQQGSSLNIAATFNLLPNMNTNPAPGVSAVGLTASLGISITHGTAEATTVAVGCPAGARCGLQARPVLARMKGITSWRRGKHTCLHPPVESFDMFFPVRAEGYAKHVPQARVTYSGCFIPGFGPKVRDPDFDYPFCPDSLNPSGSKSTLSLKKKE